MLAISEIPTPYRLPLYRRLAEHPALELEVAFCAREEPDRPWHLDDELAHVPHRVLSGLQPTLRTPRGTFVYEINPGVVQLLRATRYDVLVIGGYAVFATQVAIAYARLSRRPYVLHSESHLGKQRAAWKNTVKRAVLPQVIGRARAGLAAGSAAVAYLEAYGLPRDRIRIVPNTIDVSAYAAGAAAARANAEAIRAEHGLPEHFVLYVGRLSPEKGVGDLADALRLLGAEAPQLVVAGDGPMRSGLPTAAHLGFVQPDRLVDLYALADRVVVPSRFETWGVVVNEALASGTPVIVTDAVGAAADLVVDGVNGFVVPAGDPAALAQALSAPAPPGDPASGRVVEWDYDFAVRQFVEAMELAVA